MMSDLGHEAIDLLKMDVEGYELRALLGLEERDPEGPVSVVGGGRFAGERSFRVALDAALDSGKQVVIAGELPPAKLAEAGINQRLADRLAGGICAPIHPGDEALRMKYGAQARRRAMALTWDASARSALSAFQ